MALYIPHSIFHLARLLYVRPETFGPYYVLTVLNSMHRREEKELLAVVRYHCRSRLARMVVPKRD